MKIGPVKVEYSPRYEGDKRRQKELVAEIAKLSGVQQTISTPGWGAMAEWSKVKLLRWDRQLADMTGNLDENETKIKVLKQRRDGLYEWMMTFNAVASLPKLQQELQDIEDRQEE